ncbi:MAG: hypothetical protein P4L81_06535 [Candidatus Pacebacteria bacterium]|nr:hypothetical protein [Candidatus Paceibacterota bacterium]
MFDISGATVAVIGLDPDGFSLGKLAAAHGFETVGFDVDEVKIAQLEASDSEKSRRLLLTADASRLSDATIFVVSMHTRQGEAQSVLAELEREVAIVGSHLKEGDLVIVESIVYPGVCEHVLLPLLEKNSGLGRPGPDRSREGFYFAHAPATSAPRRVIGAANAESLSRTIAFYRTLGNETVSMRSIKETEAVPMLEDSLHDTTLALAAEFSLFFDRIGIDISNVLTAARITTVDSRSLSGIHVARTSPSAYYLARSGHEHQIDQQFLSTARRMIDYMPKYAATVLADLLREKRIAIKDVTVALLGLVDENDSAQESVGSRIREALEKRGAQVQAYDPYLAGAGTDLKSTLEQAQAAVIASDSPVFRNLTPRQFEELGIQVVLDAKNCLDKDAFAESSVIYRGIGRG